MWRLRGGFTLIEVLVALSVVSVAGLATIDYVGAASVALRTAIALEAEMEAANNVMVTAVTWSRDDLDRRIGSTSIGGLALVVSRPRPELYRLVVRSSRDLLVTVVHVETR